MTTVIALWSSEQDGYGTSMDVFASDAGLLAHLRETLEADVRTHAEHRQADLREEAGVVVEAARAAMAEKGEWEFNGNQDHGGAFQGTRFEAKRCPVGE